MALAFKARQSQRQTRLGALSQILQRSLKLIAIGLFLDCPDTLGTWRFPGVLQYFGVSYLWVALTIVLTGSWDGRAAQAADADQVARARQATRGPACCCCAIPEIRIFWREFPIVLIAPALWLLLTFWSASQWLDPSV